MTGDLHCHTRISDGSMGIEDLIFYAKRAGLDFVAITDHDSLAGVTRAEVLGKRYGIRVVAGVELACRDTTRGRSVHLLCYLPHHPDRLEGLCMRTLERRTAAGKQMIKKVMARYPVTAEHMLRQSAGSNAIYKVHLMQALWELGYADGLFGNVQKELFSSRGGSCLVTFEYPDIYEALEIARQAGCITVIAHPFQFDSFDLTCELAEKGLIDGVEYRHPRCPPERANDLLELAQRYNLIKTGGTDFHGAFSPKANPLGTCITTREDLDRLFKLSSERGRN